MLPETLKKMNVFVDGVGYLGLAEEVTLPSIERNTEEYRGAGMGGPAMVGLGWNALTMSIKLREHTQTLLKALAKHAASDTGIRFVGAYQSDTPGAAMVAIEVVARGRLDKIDLGTAKEGQMTDSDHELSLTYFRFDRNSEPLVEFDFENGVEVIAGEDVLAEARRIIGLSE